MAPVLFRIEASIFTRAYQPKVFGSGWNGTGRVEKLPNEYHVAEWPLHFYIHHLYRYICTYVHMYIYIYMYINIFYVSMPWSINSTTLLFFHLLDDFEIHNARFFN